jgi:hypothetical protein
MFSVAIAGSVSDQLRRLLVPRSDATISSRPHPVLHKREPSIIGCCESLSWCGLHRSGGRPILGDAVFKQGGRQRCKQYS